MHFEIFPTHKKNFSKFVLDAFFIYLLVLSIFFLFGVFRFAQDYKGARAGDVESRNIIWIFLFFFNSMICVKYATINMKTIYFGYEFAFL